MNKLSKYALAAGVVAGLLAAPIAVSTAAQASPATVLTADRTAGTYVNAAGQTVTAVTDAEAANAVRAAGGVAQLVTRSMAQLQSVTTALEETARIPGTSWGVDPSTNQVSVEMDSTVTGAKLTRLRQATAQFGDAVRVERIAGTLTPTAAFTSGGQGIQNEEQTIKCSLGFNARNSAGARFFLTAGHCGNKVKSWNKAADGTYLGTNRESSFPGNDYAIVTYKNSEVVPYGTVWVNGAQQQITGSRYPVDGESVSRVGTVSSDLVGAVLLTSTTVNYDDGSTVSGLIKTSLCVRHGDSGGPLFAGTVALGITSGGTNANDECTSATNDRRSYYQPVQEVLDHAALTVF